ncbi:DUF6985 domain-containing protein [Aquimarina litoralis]|uniref:DUF6985 domain-containing protein n=1 Tax=Aquimarina litoralis TaxID=584605 RepID=UPI001FE5A7BC|nr:hypothetical protein [Aquimarina litoralis]
MVVWWYGGDIVVPLFKNEELPVTFTGFIPEEDVSFIREADTALKNLTEIQDARTVTNLVYQNCIDFVNGLEEEYHDEFQEFLNIKNRSDIWKYISFNEIHVERRLWSDKDVYVSIKCNCNWEEEHGLQLVFRQGKMLTRISGIDGHITEADAYGKEDSEDFLLNEYNKTYC